MSTNPIQSDSYGTILAQPHPPRFLEEHIMALAEPKSSSMYITPPPFPGAANKHTINRVHSGPPCLVHLSGLHATDLLGGSIQPCSLCPSAGVMASSALHLDVCALGVLTRGGVAAGERAVARRRVAAVVRRRVASG